MTNSDDTLSGAHERHLLRKSNNPLFGRPRFTSKELEHARYLDRAELSQFLRDMQGVVMQCLTLGASAETDDILQLKDQLEKLYERSAGLAGELTSEQAAIQSVIAPIMSAIEKNAATDPKALQKLHDEKAARALHIELLHNKLICDLLRPDSTIGESELSASLLSEPLDSMLPLLDFFSKEQLSELYKQGHALIEKFALSSDHGAHLNLQALAQHLKKNDCA